MGTARGSEAVPSAAESLPTLNLEPVPWLRWLGPLAPQGTTLPPVPSPLREPAREWTRELVLARALQANPDVQVALANVQRQDGVRLQNIGQLGPRLSLIGSTDWRAKSLIDRSAEELLAAERPINPDPLNPIATYGYNAQLELRQTLFDGLASWHRVRQAALLEKKAAVDARELYLRVASQVRQAYDATLLRQMIAETRREAVTDLRRLAEIANKRYEAGGISEFESLRAATALRSAEADLAQAESDLARAQELMTRILYVEKPPGGLRLAGTLAPLAYDEQFDAALSRAQVSRLDLRSAQLQLEAAKMGQRVVTAGFLPRIEGFVSYGYRTSYYDSDRELEGWTAGIVGRWDIFESGQTAGAIRERRAERRIAEIRVAEAQRVIGSQIRELFAALEQARTVMASHASARDLGERSKREALRLYEVGRVSQEQVLNAEVAYRQALIGWLTAVFTHNTTIYQLDYATANERFLDGAAGATR